MNTHNTVILQNPPHVQSREHELLDGTHRQQMSLLQECALCIAWTEFLSKKDVWLWTGYKWEDLWNQNGLVSDILADINVLVDGPFIESEKDISLPYMGSKNQRVIDIKWSLGYKEPTLWWTPEKKGK